MLVFGMGGASKVCADISSSPRLIRLQAYSSLETLGSLVAPSLCSDHYSSALVSMTVSLQTLVSKKPSADLF